LFGLDLFPHLIRLSNATSVWFCATQKFVGMLHGFTG
jgi:hypothetical protein